MNYTIEEQEDNVVLAMEGRLDTSCVDTLNEKINGFISRIQDKGLLIDCSRLEYISSSGLRLLLKLRKETTSTIVLKDVQPSVRQILKITKIDNYFEIV